jgi:hypothetical protein
MIRENAVWINILPRDTILREVHKLVSGKWLCFGSKDDLQKYIPLLNKLVESGVFQAAKISRKDPAADPFPHKDCVLCVFSSDDPREKASVYAKLRELGLHPKIWKSNIDTLLDWQPGVGALALEREATAKTRGQ